MKEAMFTITGLCLCISVLVYSSVKTGEVMTIQRIQSKCLIEMQDKPHKEAVGICKERTKG